MFFKATGTISRLHILKLFQPLCVSDKKEIPVVKVLDYSNCPNNCELIDKYDYNKCTNGCTKCTLKILNNETVDTPFIITTENDNLSEKVFKRLSKSQILQYLAYHFLPLDKNGRFKYLLEKDIASFINYSLKTIKRNNEVLEKMGLIKYRYEDTGIIDVEIINYNESFKSKSKKGKGGIKIPFNVLKKILSLKNIDQIRFVLFMLERYISVASQYETFNYHKLISKKFNFLISKGKRYTKKIHEIINDLSGFFELKKNDEKIIEFKIIDELKTDNYEKTFVKECEKDILDLLEEKNIETNYKDIDDLINLSKQYGKEIVLKVLNEYNKPRYKINLGGFIRNLIKETYFNMLGVISAQI